MNFRQTHTLNSIIDNYGDKGDGIYEEAWKKKKALKAKAKEAEEKAQEELDVEFNDK
jgi:hypothetical protein